MGRDHAPDFDGAIARMPEKFRADFATSAKRVENLLNQLLASKIAAQARSHGIAGEPGPAAAHRRWRSRRPSSSWSRRTASDEFDAKKAEFEVRAREAYALDREKYREPEAVRIFDITIGMKNRGEEAALARAKEARARIAAGEDFGAVALEYSDNRITRDKGGQLPFSPAKELEANYAKGVSR